MTLIPVPPSTPTGNLLEVEERIAVELLSIIGTGNCRLLASLHGGFAHDDTNVMLLLSHASFREKTVRAEVGTAQVAPTILKALGLDPRSLDAVRVEGTSVLPSVELR